MAAAERGTRKLAAIMFTDIKSFSKKMSENEELAMQLLRIHDDTLKAVIEKYEGKIIKAIGDAFMVDFSSAVNAVKCAIEAQEQFYTYNQGKKELEKIEVRIGIHLGDVITDGNDIFGDGVNIAARIEAVTEPNRICISQDVYSQIKNKMQVETYHMGSIQLKNIPEPVEVYEILVSSVPEFSTPSKTAQQMPSKRVAEKTTKREAKEAEQIEVAKKKAEEDRQKAEQEAQAKVDSFYAKAEKLVKDGKFEEAEKAINEIFKLVAFHAGAQVLQARIEEERERKGEEQRKQEAARKQIQQQIEILLQDAVRMVEGDNFSEALLKVREVFSFDANHPRAKELEQQIIEAQKATKELKLEETKQEERQDAGSAGQEPTAQEPAIAEVSEPAPVEAPRTGPPPTRPSVGLRPRRRRGLPRGAKTLIGLIAAGALVVLFFPELERIIFPRDTTIVVAPFAFPAGIADTAGYGAAIAAVLSEDLSQYRQLVVIRPPANLPARMTARELANQLQARYVLSGSIRSLSPKLSVTVRLDIAEVNATAWERTYESDPFAMNDLRRAATLGVLQTMELGNELLETTNLSHNPFVTEEYLRSLPLVTGYHYGNLLRGIELLKDVLRSDSAFPMAYVMLGRALLRQYRMEGERNRVLLRDAADAALKARGLNPAFGGIYEVLGSAYRAAGQYGPAMKNLERSLELLPGSPETYRQLAMLAVIEGKYDRGLEYASKAALLDPRSPETHEILGHVYYFKQQLNRAQNAYDEAITLGANRYVVTTRYKLAVWAAGLSPEPAAEYCRELLKQDTSNYVLKYWIGRAYMLSGLWSQAKGYLETGAATLKKLVETHPQDAELRAFLALYHARLGESANGLAEIDKAIELSGETAPLLYRKAQFFAIQTGKHNEALEWLSKAVRQEFILTEVMNPDFAFVVKEPAFAETIAREIQPSE